MRPILVALLLTAALAGCNSRKPRLGCGADDLRIVQRLAIAGEQPWCDGKTTPHEGYRFIWGPPQRPVVISVVAEDDTATLHAYVSEIEEDDFLYPFRDTTYTMHPLSFAIEIQGRDWRPGEPSKTGFTKELWQSESIQPRPAAVPEPAIWVLESVRNGRYHASVRWNPSWTLDRRFMATAYRMAQLAIADQHIMTGRRNR